jgi:hypothetical protein
VIIIYVHSFYNIKNNFYMIKGAEWCRVSESGIVEARILVFYSLGICEILLAGIK